MSRVMGGSGTVGWKIEGKKTLERSQGFKRRESDGLLWKLSIVEKERMNEWHDGRTKK